MTDSSKCLHLLIQVWKFNTWAQAVVSGPLSLQVSSKWLWTDDWCRMIIVGWVRAWKTTRRRPIVSGCCWRGDPPVTRSVRGQQRWSFQHNIAGSRNWKTVQGCRVQCVICSPSVLSVNTFPHIVFQYSLPAHLSFCYPLHSLILFPFSSSFFSPSLHYLQHDGFFAKLLSLLRSFFSALLSDRVQEVKLYL